MKLKVDAYLLHTFFGVFGAGRFYVGDIKLGILNLFTFGGVGLLWLADFFLLWRRVEAVNTMIDAMHSFAETSYSAIDTRLLTEFKDNAYIGYSTSEDMSLEKETS